MGGIYKHPLRKGNNILTGFINIRIVSGVNINDIRASYNNNGKIQFINDSDDEKADSLINSDIEDDDDTSDTDNDVEEDT